jgi:hypothetical protein
VKLQGVMRGAEEEEEEEEEEVAPQEDGDKDDDEDTDGEEPTAAAQTEHEVECRFLHSTANPSESASKRVGGGKSSFVISKGGSSIAPESKRGVRCWMIELGSEAASKSAALLHLKVGRGKGTA